MREVRIYMIKNKKFFLPALCLLLTLPAFLQIFLVLTISAADSTWSGYISKSNFYKKYGVIGYYVSVNAENSSLADGIVSGYCLLPYKNNPVGTYSFSNHEVSSDNSDYLKLIANKLNTIDDYNSKIHIDPENDISVYQAMLKTMYYGESEGYDYAIIHMALACIWHLSSYADSSSVWWTWTSSTTHISDSGLKLVKELIEFSSVRENLNGIVAVMRGKADNSINRQDIMTGFVFEDEPEPERAELYILKSSENPDITDGNVNYSLKNAEYTIYTEYEGGTQINSGGGVYTGGRLSGEIAKISTDEFGTGVISDLEIGTYYVKESGAPAGYEQDEYVYRVELTSSARLFVDKANTSYSVFADENCTDFKKNLSSNSEGYINLSGLANGIYYMAETVETTEITIGSTLTGFIPGNSYAIYYDEDLTGFVGTLFANDYGELDFSALPEGRYYVETDSGRISSIQVNNSIVSFLESGATYNIYTEPAEGNEDGNLVFVRAQTADENGEIIISDLSAGSYFVSKAVSVFKVTVNKTEIRTTLTVSDKPKLGSLKLKKTSSNEDISSGNMNYSFEGAVFGIFSDYDSVSGDVSNIVGSIVTDIKGEGLFEGLVFGTYFIKEIFAPKGYELNDEVKEIFIDESNSLISYEINISDTPFADPLTLILQKIDMETGEVNEMLAGAYFTVKYYAVDNESEIETQSPERIWVFETDASGTIKLSAEYLTTESEDELYTDGEGNYVFPIGYYTIEETRAPAGYLKDDTIYVVNTSVSNNMIKTFNLPTDEKAVKEQIIRGSFKINKIDIETMLPYPLGAASLEGAEFTLYNRSEYPVLVDTDFDGEFEVYDTDSVIEVFVTDENAHVAAPLKYLPYGDYEITETKAPEGYLSGGSATFSILIDNEIVDLTSAEYAISNQIKRCDFYLDKKDEYSNPLEKVVFKISSDTTGETHYFATDSNGIFDSSKKDKSNILDSVIDSEGNIDEEELDNLIDECGLGGSTYGIWFGEGTKSDESLGSLPYDIYTVTEMRSSANEGQILCEFKLTVCGNGEVYDYGTITNIHPSMSTELLNSKNGTHFAEASDNESFTETVYVQNVKPGEIYVARAVLMLADSHEIYCDQEGMIYDSSRVIEADDSIQKIKIEFNGVDCRGLEGKSLVAFAYYYDSEGSLLVSEEDYENEDESIYFADYETEEEINDDAEIAEETVSEVRKEVNDYSVEKADRTEDGKEDEITAKNVRTGDDRTFLIFILLLSISIVMFAILIFIKKFRK